MLFTSHLLYQLLLSFCLFHAALPTTIVISNYRKKIVILLVSAGCLCQDGSMAASYKQRLLRIQRDFERQLDADLGELAQQIGQRVLARAVPVEGGERAVPNQQNVRAALRREIWAGILKPYFIGASDEALDRTRPQSEYARLIVEGI